MAKVRMHKDKRLAFSFMENYYQVYRRLSKEQKVQFMDKLLAIQFLEEDYKGVEFDNAMTDMAFHSILHHIQSTIDGYLVQARNSNMFIGAHIGGMIGGIKEEKEKEKEKEEEKEEEEEKSFSFMLKKDISYESTSLKYKEKLKAKCLLIDGNLSRYEDFIMSLETKGYKYKDFSKAYKMWDKEKAYKTYKPDNEPMLGADWYRVRLADNGIVAINSKTLEMKFGTVKIQANARKEEANNYRPNIDKLLKVKGF